jgi:hypothetical protein
MVAGEVGAAAAEDFGSRSFGSARFRSPLLLLLRGGWMDEWAGKKTTTTWPRGHTHTQDVVGAHLSVMSELDRFILQLKSLLFIGHEIKN